MSRTRSASTARPFMARRRARRMDAEFRSALRDASPAMQQELLAVAMHTANWTR